MHFSRSLGGHASEGLEKKVLFTWLLKPQHDQLISTGRRIHRVVDFNGLQVVDFNELRLNMPILLTTQGRPRSGRPCFVHCIGMFSLNLLKPTTCNVLKSTTR